MHVSDTFSKLFYDNGIIPIINNTKSKKEYCQGELVEPDALNESRLRKAQDDNFYNLRD